MSQVRASFVSFSGLLVLGFVLGQAMPLGCEAGTIVSDASTADAQSRAVQLQGSCNRGEILVYDGGDQATCKSLDELLPRCSHGEFLTTSSGGDLECEGGGSDHGGAKGLLPDCSSGTILVSEGFARWSCEER